MRWLVEVVWLLAAAIAYGAYAPEIAIGGAAPVLPLIVVVRVALRNGALAGNLLGFLSGLLVDVFSLTWFGSNMLIGSLVGYAMGAMRGRMVLDSLLARILATLVATVAYCVALVLVRDYAQPMHVQRVMTALGSGFYTTVVAAAWWSLGLAFGRAFGWRSMWDVERQ